MESRLPAPIVPVPPWLTAAEAAAGLQKLEGPVTMIGQVEFSVLLSELQSQHPGASNCVTVWTAGTFAYRCRQCQVNDSSAICVACFQAGDHRMHDYVMYRSESGGCCDCGDPVSWKESGFCSIHKQRRDLESCSLPQHLVAPFQAAVHDAVIQLLQAVGPDQQHLEDGAPKEGYEVAAVILDWLQKVCGVSALRDLVCDEVTKRSLVADKFKTDFKPEQTKLDLLLEDFPSLPAKVMEKATTLFLLLLYNHGFKDTFSRVLIKHYPAMILSPAAEEDNIRQFKLVDSSLDRVMVQLFNVADITMLLIQQHGLLECFLQVLHKVLKQASSSRTGVVKVSKKAILERLYSRPLGDLRLILGHAAVALHVLTKRHDLLLQFLSILTMLQGMNKYKRGVYVDLDENKSWMHAITLEVYMISVVGLLAGGCHSIFLASEQHKPEAAREARRGVAAAGCVVLQYVLDWACQDLARLEATGGLETGTKSMSQHLPLHRALATFIAKLLQEPLREGSSDNALEGLLPREAQDKVALLMEHPLRIMVWMSQIRAREWRMLNEDLSRLERVYHSSYWHDQSLDMDILLMQFCTATTRDVEKDILLRMVDRFQVSRYVLENSPTEDDGESSQGVLQRLQGLLRLLLLIVRERRHTGMTELEALQYEVVQWLCHRDHTYTQLTNALSATLAGHPQLNNILQQVAVYSAPKVQERGSYRLKPEYWVDFDPLFSHYSMKELEAAQVRATDIGKVGRYWRVRPCGPFQPPFDHLPDLLHAKACHVMLGNVLHLAADLSKAAATASSGRAIAMLALQLCATALLDKRPVSKSQRASEPCTDGPPGSDLPTNDLAVNLYIRRADWSASIYDRLTLLKAMADDAHVRDCIDYILELAPRPGQLTPLATAPIPQVVADSSKEEEKRRELKKQRQAAILAEFKAKQKAFLTEHIEEASPEATPSGLSANPVKPSSSPSLKRSLEGESREGVTGEAEAGPSGYSRLGLESGTGLLEKEGDQDLHECAFCRGNAESSASPMAWISFVQPYNLPEISSRSAQPLSSLDEALKLRNCRSEEQSVLTLVVPEAERKGSRVKEHIRCCGHQMHLECFQRYMDSLIRSHASSALYEGLGLVDLERLEFLCPTCRRLANVLLPDATTVAMDLHLERSQPEVVEGSSEEGLRSLLRQVAAAEMSEEQKLALRSFWQSNEGWRKALEHFVAQCFHPGSPLADDVADTALAKTPWEELARGVVHAEVETRPTSNGKEEQPLASPVGVGGGSGQGAWGCNAASWRALAALGKLAPLATTIDPGTGLGSLGTMRSLLWKLLEEDSDSNDESHPGIIGLDAFDVLMTLLLVHQGLPSSENLRAMLRIAYEVVATQSLLAVQALRSFPDVQSDASSAAVVQEACLVFLRRAALLISLVCGAYFPPIDSLRSKAWDFSALQGWLRMPPLQECLQAGGLAERSLRRRAPRPPKLLRAKLRTSLVRPPGVFQELLLQMMGVPCKSCQEVPQEPALCLICSELVCCNNECCMQEGVGECFRHARTCGAGLGLFLLLRSTQLLLIRGGRVCMAPSLYLDVHGEEDVFLKRGRPLRLSELRLKEIERLWLTAALDHDSHILHSSHLGSELL